MILLDTDICIEYLRGNKKLSTKLESENVVYGISFMTLCELNYGAYNSPRVDYHLSQVNQLAGILEVIHSDQLICETFGSLKSNLKTKGTLIQDADILIGATAMIRADLLVTGNVAHFDRFEEFGLKIENWL